MTPSEVRQLLGDPVEYTGSEFAYNPILDSRPLSVGGIKLGIKFENGRLASAGSDERYVWTSRTDTSIFDLDSRGMWKGPRFRKVYCSL